MKDLDEPGLVSGYYTLALPTTIEQVQEPRSTHSFFSENFVDAELVPCYVGDCSGATTAVTSDSWARIKAAFQYGGGAAGRHAKP